MRDVLPVRRIVSDEVEEVQIGSVQDFLYVDGKVYKAKVINKG